jgi:hypothetical protein
VTGAPERVGNFAGRGRRIAREILLDAVQQSQCGGLPERGARPALEQPARGFSLNKRRSAARSPLRMAATTATAIDSSERRFMP